MAEIITKAVDQLIINQLTREEYKELVERHEVHLDEIYLFPDTEASDEELRKLAELVKELSDRVDELTESNNELVLAVQAIQEILNGSSENPGLVDVIFGRDGKDGLIKDVEDIHNRVTIIEEWMDALGSEGWDETRIKDIEESVEDLSDKVDEQEQKLQEVTNNYTTLDGRVTNIENNAIMADESSESSEEEFDGLIIFGGTATEVIEDLVPTV